MNNSPNSLFNFIKNRPYFGYFSLLFFLFFLAQMITELSIAKFDLNDFKVYYSAAQNYWNGEKVYGVHFGLDTGFYKYSPVILLLFTPFLALPFTLAATLYYLINLFAIVYLFYRFFLLIENHFTYKRKVNFAILMVIQLSFLGHFLRELHLGNTNLLLLLMAVICHDTILRHKTILPGILLSLLILTKPYFGLLLLPILVLQKKSVLVSWAISTGILVVLSILFFGFTNAYQLHIDWIYSMKEHSDYLSSNNTIFHVFDQIFKTETPAYIGLPAYTLSAILLFLLFWKKQRKSIENSSKNFILFFFLLLALFPNFLITDTEHFLFSFGLISILALELFERRSKWIWLPYALLIVLYLGETNLFLPRAWSDAVKFAGGMGIANLILIVWSLYFIYFSPENHLKQEQTLGY